MPSTTVQDEIISEIHIAAEPHKVFAALVDPSLVPQWWGQKGIYICTKYEADLRVGGRWRSAGIGRDGGPFSARGEFVEIEPPRILAYTWIASWTGEVQTNVRWELLATANGTRVTIRHRGLAAHPEVAQAYRGWPRMLQWLQAFLEKDETAEMRPAV